jgi:glutamine synthetase
MEGTMTVVDTTRGADTPLGRALAAGDLAEMEVAFTDHQGHMCGKRIPAHRIARGAQVAFCSAALAWDYVGDVHDGTSLTGPDSGYPDAFLRPDPSTYRRLPWRPEAGHVISDVVDHHGELLPQAPRSVLRRAIERIAGLGYDVRMGLEIELYLLNADGAPASTGVHCYSLQKANDLDPAASSILHGMGDFVELEGANVEYGPGQFEVNLANSDALSAADAGIRLKYGVREMARREGVKATFMAKPFNKVSGSSMHLHVSLWKDGEPAFAPENGAENPLMRLALGGLIRHLPGIAVYGSPTVNSYKRFEIDSFAPTNVSWGGDNRTVSIRSLVESPSATRIELRTPAADANPYWASAALLTAIAAGIQDGDDPGSRGEGYLYGIGDELPQTLGDAIRVARADAQMVDMLGRQPVEDFLHLSSKEWRAFTTQVSSWDIERYQGAI